MSYFNDLSTPCIGICSTIYGDDICRGCKRTYQEVIDWNAYTNQQKHHTLSRLNTLTQEVMARYIEITDINKLKAKLEKHAIKYRAEFHPLTWAYTLLREGCEKMKGLTKYGLQATKPYQDLSPFELFQQCDDEMFAQCGHQYRE